MLHTKFKLYESSFYDDFDFDEDDELDMPELKQFSITSRILTPEQWKKKNPKYKHVYYHGSKTKFDMFDLHNNKTYKEFDLPTWFFTKDIDYAQVYGNYIYTVNLNIKKTFNTEIPKHYDMLIQYMKNSGMDNQEIDNYLDERMYNGLPYWTCDDAYYAAKQNGFDSIFLQEELDNEVISIGVFDKELIEILDIIKK